MLGEYADYKYKAKLRNDGAQDVRVVLRDKDSKAEATSITLRPGQGEAVVVSANQEVTLQNASISRATVYVTMSKTVEGMRYVANDGSEPAAMDKPSPQQARPLSLSAEVVNQKPQEQITQQLSQGEALVLGEGTQDSYSVDFTSLSGSINVSVRDRKTGEQTQGFGLGRKATVYIRPNEVIYLLNAGSGRARVKAKFSAAVRGARVERSSVEKARG